MELIIKPEKEIEEYIKKGVTCFLLPLKDYSVEYSTYYELDDIKSIREKYKDIDIFVSMNKNYMNEDIDNIKKILKELDKLSLKGIFFYDAALLKIKNDLDLSIDLVWNQTHMVTNYKTCDFYNDMGAKYALLSKEITQEEIVDIINKSRIVPIVELITKPSIAFSKRKLVSHYYENFQQEKTNQIMIHEKISDTDIIVNENKDGVFFIKNNILNGCFILDCLLRNNLGYVLLKEDFINHELFMKIIDNITHYINNYNNLNDIEKNKWLEQQVQLLGSSTEFFFQKTIYRVKK